MPETGEVTVVGLAFLGLFMTLFAFLGFVDRHTRRN
ncbi:LPXTG cell wall anchor domain-containing protein [Streptococcus thermophilus]|nr:LPXTG cell wall anchor domain-containing protein [Streptococcus thermophilus]MBW7828430.1 LPXTG cell wall anchor domain-containing protein [Streptococcus thermophilus]MCA6641046.1 LPXTG cell wall anchor domain-containing protein [Streptococcus thermophilus]MCA6644363.1 LPXTG cell wall anchor domain-containing protein [Streptococcus thermophilus]